MQPPFWRAILRASIRFAAFGEMLGTLGRSASRFAPVRRLVRCPTSGYDISFSAASRSSHMSDDFAGEGVSARCSILATDAGAVCRRENRDRDDHGATSDWPSPATMADALSVDNPAITLRL